MIQELGIAAVEELGVVALRGRDSGLDGVPRVGGRRGGRAFILPMRRLCAVYNSGMFAQIRQAQSQLREICIRRHIRRLELFGSAAREDFGPESDLDFLVEFETTPNLKTYFGLKEDLQALFGRPADLVMFEAVRNPYVRAAIAQDRQLLYAA